MTCELHDRTDLQVQFHIQLSLVDQTESLSPSNHQEYDLRHTHHPSTFHTKDPLNMTHQGFL